MSCARERETERDRKRDALGVTGGERKGRREKERETKLWHTAAFGFWHTVSVSVSSLSSGNAAKRLSTRPDLQLMVLLEPPFFNST